MTDDATVDFDHMTPEFAKDPAKAWRDLRQRCPVAHSPHHGGFWILSRYDDLAMAARDDTTFSSERHPPDSGLTAITIPQVPNPVLNVPIELDPPAFHDYRRLLNPLLSPAAVGRLAPTVDALITYSIDRVIAKGSCDLVADIASPVPALFTLLWLGLPVDEWERFAEANHDIVAFPPDHELFAKAIEGQVWQAELVAATIAGRRREPRNDVISYLLAQQVDGERLSDSRVREMVSLLIAGGVDTTTSLIGHALMYLDDKQDVRQKLVADPALLDTATEEFLRYFCPVTTLARTVMADVEIGGQTLRAGDRVLLPWAAANRDPEVFEDPEQVLLDRTPNRHAAFGLGIHRCVGSNLARMTFKRTLTAVLERMPDYRVDASRAHQYPSQGLNSGWSELHASFTPGTPRGDGFLPPLGAAPSNPVP